MSSNNGNLLNANINSNQSANENKLIFTDNAGVNSNMEMETGVMGKIKGIGEKIGIAIDVYSIIFLFAGLTILMIVLYFLSKPYALTYAKSTADLYIKYNEISSINYAKMGSVKLGRCMVAASYNSVLLGSQMFGYVSEEILLYLLKAGVRYFEFNIFNSTLREDAIPIISNGYNVGEWKMTINTATFEDCIKILAENAFTISKSDKEGCPNPEDPLFIGLNLNTNNNIHTLDIMARILKKNFKAALMDSKYAYQNENLALAPLVDFRKKVCILASKGFEGSKLEEFINGCWDGQYIRRIHHDYLETANLQMLREYNRKNLTIVVPHREGDYRTINYDPSLAIDCGCQFISMNYQVIDEHIDTMITTFRNNSIVLKQK